MWQGMRWNGFWKPAECNKPCRAPHPAVPGPGAVDQSTAVGNDWLDDHDGRESQFHRSGKFAVVGGSTDFRLDDMRRTTHNGCCAQPLILRF